jgi:hypothetical protein
MRPVRAAVLVGPWPADDEAGDRTFEPVTSRQGQTRRKAGTQSHGTSDEVSRAAEGDQAQGGDADTEVTPCSLAVAARMRCREPSSGLVSRSSLWA